MSRVYFIIGCGRSGKTTKARELADSIPGAVLVDEAQFLESGTLERIITDCKENGVDLILSGLGSWANGKRTELGIVINWRAFCGYTLITPTRPGHICPCGCGRPPEIDYKLTGDKGKQVDTSRDLYVQVCFSEWYARMKRDREEEEVIMCYKSCPFCGEKNIQRGYGTGVDLMTQDSRPWIGCPTCQLWIRGDDCVRRWQTRTTSSQAGQKEGEVKNG